MTETINQRCARLCKEWETAVAGVQAGKLNSQVAGEAYDRYAAAMAERSAAQSGDTASATASVGVSTTPTTPAPSTAEIAQRRKAEVSAFWKRVIGKVNAEMFGGQTDSAPDASREGTSPHDKAPKPDSKAVWKKAVAKVNAGIAGGAPSASQERQASPDRRPQTGSGEFLSSAMTAAGKQLKDAGFAVVR